MNMVRNYIIMSHFCARTKKCLKKQFTSKHRLLNIHISQFASCLNEITAKSHGI